MLSPMILTMEMLVSKKEGHDDDEDADADNDDDDDKGDIRLCMVCDGMMMRTMCLLATSYNYWMMRTVCLLATSYD